MPAWKYAFRTQDASGIFSWWNDQEILLTQIQLGTPHDELLFEATNLPAECQGIEVAKRYVRPQLVYTWDVWFENTNPSVTSQKVVQFEVGACNLAVIIGSMSHPLYPGASTGSTFRLEPVEFDATAPPGE